MAHSITPPRWWNRGVLQETALVALTTVFGLQVLRVLLAELVFYLRDSLGTSPAVPGAYAFALFLSAFLAAPIHRSLGPRCALLLTAGGLALMRLAEQFVPWPVADLALTTLGAALFLAFIPVYVGRLRGWGAEGGRAFALGILLGIGMDTAIKGVFATLDLSWQPGVATYAIIIFLVGCHWLLLRTSLSRFVPPRVGGSQREGEFAPIPTFPHRGGRGGDNGFLQSASLTALGPVLFLEALLFQNIGQQTALINWAQPLVFTWVVVANAVGILAAIIAMARPDYGGWLSLAALGGLFVLLALGERSGLAAATIALFGQAAISMSLGTIGVALGSGETRPGIRGIATASGLGMMLLLVLAFLYYGSYQFRIPGGTSVSPLIGVAVIFLCVAGVAGGRRRRTSRRDRDFASLRATMAWNWASAAVAFLLLAMPLGYLVAWEEPGPVLPSGFPVRVMSYNLHQGFDVKGYLAIEEQAEVIEEQQPDIVALQEVSRGWIMDGSFDMLVWLSRRLDMPYVWGPAADSVWGNAIISRYPISSALTQPMPNNSQLQMKRSFTTVQVDLGSGESLTVIATHLHHVVGEGHIREPQVRALLQALNPTFGHPSPTGGRREGDEGTGKGPALSLPKGRDVVNNIERTIILGDFNASPNSPEMLLLREAGLKDAFLAAFTLSPSPKSPQPPFSKGGQGGISTGRGEGRESGYTYPSHNPSRRIDYIWASSDLKVRDFTLADSLASDHLGVAVMVDR